MKRGGERGKEGERRMKRGGNEEYRRGIHGKRDRERKGGKIHERWMVKGEGGKKWRKGSKEAGNKYGGGEELGGKGLNEE